MTVAEYLAAEANADVRHELINGEAYAMAGGTAEHAAIAANLALALGMRLRSRSCRATNSDQRLHVPATGAFFYADLLVICGGYRFAEVDPQAVINPTLIVEVLSPPVRNPRGAGRLKRRHRLHRQDATKSRAGGTATRSNDADADEGKHQWSAPLGLRTHTADYDQGTKFQHYRRLETLQEYVLVHAHERRIEHRQRLDDGAWLMRETTEGALELPALGLQIPLDEIYDLVGVRPES